MGSINTTKLIKMKRLLLLLSFFIFVFQACEKQDSLKLNKTDTKKIEFDVSDGILSFNKGADFFALGEKLSTMSQEELLVWENETGFVSMRTEFEYVLTMLDQCETKEQYENIMNKNADIITIEGEYLQPVIKSGFHNLIANRNGFYIVENVLYKVTSEGVYSCNTKSTEQIEKAIATGLNKENQNVTFVPRVEISVESNTLKSATGATYVWARSATTDYRSCYARVYLSEVWYGNEPRTFRYYVSCFSQAEGRGIFGGITLYKSAHYTNGLTVKLDAPYYFEYGYGGPRIVYGEQIETLYPDGPTSDTKTYTWWNSIKVGNDIVMTQDQIQHIGTPKTTIEYASGSFYTRGTGSDIVAQISF
jgi:hypothetical protein